MVGGIKNLQIISTYSLESKRDQAPYQVILETLFLLPFQFAFWIVLTMFKMKSNAIFAFPQHFRY